MKLLAFLLSFFAIVSFSDTDIVSPETAVLDTDPYIHVTIKVCGEETELTKKALHSMPVKSEFSYLLDIYRGVALEGKYLTQEEFISVMEAQLESLKNSPQKVEPERNKKPTRNISRT